MDRGAWQATVHRVEKSQTHGSDLVSTLVRHEADWILDQKRKTNKKLPRIVWGQSETTQYGLCVN